ncbi:MAG: integrase [Gammaproteobacteria bacterium]
MSHLYTKAIEWGIVETHPMVGKFKKKHAMPSRTYITDETIAEALKTAPPLIHAYVILKLLTGLRMGDMLSLKIKGWQSDGLHVTPRKTQHSSGKSLVFERTPELESAINAVLALKHPHITEYLFCTRDGNPYIKANGIMNGLQSVWQRWQQKVPERFKERDIRVKVGPDSASDEEAAKRLGHSATSTTRKHYRAKPEVVRPLNR